MDCFASAFALQGKILRRRLRDPYWAGKDRQVN
jgi:hypothetical protein